MSGFLHYDLPLDDAAMEEVAKVLGIKWQYPKAETRPAEEVQVCPMSDSDSNFTAFITMQAKYDKH